MTRSPKKVSADESLETLQRLMRDLAIRHFPVEKNGKLVGIVSERNVSAALMHPQGKKLKAEDVMIDEPFIVPPHEPLDLVVASMAEEKFGCAIVQQEDGTVVGIFTTVDACRAFRQVLETVYPA